MENRIVGRRVGILFLAAFLCYGVGSTLTDRAIGAGLMLLNSVVVAAIGVLVFRLLRRPHRATAVAYLISRLLESLLLAIGVVLLVGMESVAGNDLAYQFAMIILGLGSLPFCRAMLHDQFLPRWLAAWGMVGYAMLAAGAVLELLDRAGGLLFAIPGGLFEVALGMTLVARGFPGPMTTPPEIQLSGADNRLGASA